MKTLVDEQEIQASPVVSNNEKSRQAAPKNTGSQKLMPAAASSAQSQADCHESCLELAALFIARG
jgi:hypothetical protein